MKKMVFAAAMKDFFGLQPSQTLPGFLQELKAPNTDDRAYFIVGLKQNGYDIQSAA